MKRYILMLTCFIIMMNSDAQTTKYNQGTSGNWSDPNTWTPAGVPAYTDSVILRGGANITIDISASCAVLIVGNSTGPANTLSFDPSRAYALYVTGNMIIGNNGVLRSPLSGNITSYIINVGGDVQNNGVLDLNNNNTGAGLVFNHASADQTFTCASGSTTRLRQSIGFNGGVHVNKGSSNAGKLTLIDQGTSLTVNGGTTLGFLSIANGTVEIAGSSSFTNPVWNTPAYTISSTAGFILNNPNATITAQAGSVTLNGRLEIKAGTYQIGTAANNALTATSGATILMNGGNLNVAGFLRATGASYIQNSGTVTVCTIGTSVASTPVFQVAGASSNFTLAGGTLILMGRATGSGTTVDLDISATSVIPGSGTLQLDNANFRLSVDSIAYLSLYNGPVTATLMRALNITKGIYMPHSSSRLLLNGRTLTIGGQITGTGTLSGTGNSDLTINGTGSFGTMYFDQSNPGVTNRFRVLSYNRAGQVFTLGNNLEITFLITPTAGTLATGGFLTLTSTATGTARISSGNGTYITGAVKVERYIQPVARRWRFLSTPVQNTTLEDWRGEIFITGAGTGNTVGTLNSNGFDATASSAPGAARYNEANTKPFADSGWVFLSNNTSSLTNVPLVTGLGYRIFVRGDRSTLDRLNGVEASQNAVTLNLNGPVNTGNIVMPVSYTSSGTAAADGWSFLGNPYPCQIDWNMFHDAGRTGTNPNFSGTNYTRLSPTVYVYDATSNSYKSYNAVSNSGTLSSGVIPSGGSFFVQATGAAPSMTLTESFKTSFAPLVYLKTEKTDELLIRLSSDSINYDECILKYSNEATKANDDHDILKLNNADVNIGSHIDSMDLTLDARPFVTNTGDMFFLNLTTRASGNYPLDFSGMETFAAGYRLFLIDRFIGTVTDIRQTKRYMVSIDKNNSASEGRDRFMIILTKKDDTGMDDLLNKDKPASLFLYPTSTDRTVTIHSKMPIGRTADITVLDVTGKEVSRFANQVWNNNSIDLDLSSYKQGMYFITLTTNTQSTPVVLRCIKQ